MFCSQRGLSVLINTDTDYADINKVNDTNNTQKWSQGVACEMVL